VNKLEFTNRINDMLKLIRIEYGYTQEEMAYIIGISKKTLVESEKGRRTLSWTEAVAVATIFSQSEILQNAFGGDTSDIIVAIGFENMKVNYPKTKGGKVWWKNVLEENEFRIQKNLVSQHYRLLNVYDQRLMSSYNYDEVYEYYKSIKK